MKVKLFVKSRLQHFVCSQEVPIIIASSGRAGSTVLAKSISRSLPLQSPILCLLQHYRPSFFITFESTLDSALSSPSPIVKTHSLYECSNYPPAKIIYIFGDPFESALSVWSLLKTRGPSWVQNHLKHLHSDESIHNLFLVDALNYKKQLETWMNCPRALILHYSELWDASESIAEHLGFSVSLPSMTNRKAKALPTAINKELFIDLRHLEQSLYRKVSITGRPLKYNYML